MHHFTNIVASTLTTSRTAQLAWQGIVPQRAETHPVLMHALLALAGLHLALRDNSASAYGERALVHKQATIAIFRQEVARADSRNSENRLDVLTLVSTIVAMLAFAQWHVEAQPPSLDDIVDVFALTQGVRTLWESGYRVDRASEIAAIYHNDAAENDQQGEPAAHEAGQLANRVEALRADAHKAMHSEALALLADVTSARHPSTSEIRPVGHWPACISTTFLASLRARDPTSMAILEVYGDFIQHYEHLWWVGDWHRKIGLAVRR